MLKFSCYHVVYNTVYNKEEDC